MPHPAKVSMKSRPNNTLNVEGYVVSLLGPAMLPKAPFVTRLCSWHSEYDCLDSWLCVLEWLGLPSCREMIIPCVVLYLDGCCIRVVFSWYGKFDQCDGRLYVSTWLDHRVPRYLAKYYLWVYLWGYLWMRLIFELVDWVKEITFSNVGGHHPICWGPE